MNNRRYVITGGPSSGKTTTVDILKRRGYRTTIEHARHYIDLQRIAGRTTDEIRSKRLEFQHAILVMQVAAESSLNPNETVFLDRAIPDAVAYYKFHELEEDEPLREALSKAEYSKIFILDPLPLAPDYARTEDETAQRKIHGLITEVYEKLPYPVVHVPVLPPEERVDFILTHL